jgi:hypothetical protein
MNSPQDGRWLASPRLGRLPAVMRCLRRLHALTLLLVALTTSNSLASPQEVLRYEWNRQAEEACVTNLSPSAIRFHFRYTYGDLHGKVATLFPQSGATAGAVPEWVLLPARKYCFSRAGEQVHTSQGLQLIAVAGNGTLQDGSEVLLYGGIIDPNIEIRKTVSTTDSHSKHKESAGPDKAPGPLPPPPRPDIRLVVLGAVLGSLLLVSLLSRGSRRSSTAAVQKSGNPNGAQKGGK